MSLFRNSPEKKRGATEAEILEAEKATNLKFPAGYRKFISDSDGLDFEKQAVSILSLKKSLEYFEMLREFGITQTWGYFPILDNEDSNPWCVCCGEPIIGYIVQLFHDDAAKIKFRSIEGFFAAILASERDDVLMLDGLQGDFRINTRASQDVAVARRLLNAASTCTVGDRSDACRFAMWLLGDGEVDEVVPLLEDQDPFVARDATERLTAMQCSKAREALQARRKSLAEFVMKSLDILRQNGMQATIENENLIRLAPKNVLLDMKVFYAERKAPDAERKLIERAKFFMAIK